MENKINFDYYSVKKYNNITDEKLMLIEAEYILKYKPKHNKVVPKNNKYISIKKLKKNLNIAKPKIKQLIKYFNLKIIEFNCNYYINSHEFYNYLKIAKKKLIFINLNNSLTKLKIKDNTGEIIDINEYIT